ncbi:MAG: cyclic nucleotide-binding domain-containing protein [Leptospiraceae bacterium]|nr:cyclic nucleotide-binding domain-containing protein [Leptospiraceae bacterium]
MQFNVLFLVSVIPVVISYFLFQRYSQDKNIKIKTFDALLFGVISASLLVLVHSKFKIEFSANEAIYTALLNASFLEKLVAFIFINYLLRVTYKENTVHEGITISIFYSLGFAILENIFYAYEFQKPEILLRFFSSVPLHLGTNSIMGYLLGLHLKYETKTNRFIYFILAFFIPFLFHGLYDFSLLLGGKSTYFVAPILVMLITFQEYYFAKSLNYPSGKSLKVKKISLEDFEVIQKQTEYERWIFRSMGKKSPEIVPFFKFNFDLGRILFIGILCLVSILYYSMENFLHLNLINLSREEEITLFVLYPLVGAFNLFLVGAINPDYFKSSQLSLPVVGNFIIQNQNGFSEISGTDITNHCIFLKTIDVMEKGKELEVTHNYSIKSSPKIKGRVVWDNHENLIEPIGTILRVESHSLKFKIYLFKFFLFRFTRGLIFNLKLPGFESLRNHFVKTITVMEDHAYVSEGTILFREGDKGKEFYFLKRGKVEIYKTSEDGDRVVLSTVEAGNIFGEMSMITGQPRAATAICQTNCLISMANGDNLQALIQNNPEFSQKFIRTLSNRIANSEVQLMNRIKELELELREMRQENAIFKEIFYGEVKTDDNFVSLQVKEGEENN